WPEDALAVVTGDRAQIPSTFLQHPAVEVVSYTGGVAVGKTIAERLGYRRAVLELGGNDPLIVLEDADLDEAARLAVAGATKNSGQRCTAVKRILVAESIADALAERVEILTSTLVVGDPFWAAPASGAVIDEGAAAVVARRVRDAGGDGAQLRCGGERSGAQIVPPVLDRVSPDSELVREETFGPAVP